MANGIVRFDGTADSGSPFDSIRQADGDGKEFWSARDLMGLLGYPRWNEFVKAIDRAEVSCKTLEGSSTAHFRNTAKMIEIGCGATRKVVDFDLSAFGVLLVLFECDPRKVHICKIRALFVQKAFASGIALGELVQALSNFEIPEDLLHDDDLYVYAIQNIETKSIKLGISRNPRARLQTLQTGSDARLILLAQKAAKNGFKDEKQLHKQFEDYKKQGEWFSVKAEDGIIAEFG